jgi:hypothetical protein
MAQNVSRNCRRSSPALASLDLSVQINTPEDAAIELLPLFGAMFRGTLLLLLTEDRICIGGVRALDLPRNTFTPLLKLVAGDTAVGAAYAILGVFSPEAEIPLDPFIFTTDTLNTMDRLALESATVEAWQQFGIALSQRGVVLLDVIECGVSGWASTHGRRTRYDSFQ